jgi:hypothetical protein
MNPKSILVLAIVALLIWFVLTPMVGLGGGGLVAVFFLVFILGLASFVPALKKFGIGIPIVGKKLAQWITIIAFIGLIGTGGFFTIMNTFGINLALPLGSFDQTQEFISYMDVEPEDTAEFSQCSKSAIGDELWGKTATVTVNAYDQEAANPYSSAVDVDCHVWKHTGTGWKYIPPKLTDTSAASVTGLSVGDYIKITGSDATSTSSAYYLDEEEFCIDSQSFNPELDAHAWPAGSNLKTVAYDNKGNALSSGTTNESDYYLALGANEDKQIQIETTTNVAVKAYRFCGYATAEFNDIDDFYPTSSDFTHVVTPKWLKNVAVIINETSAGTISTDYDVYKLDTPFYLTEWEDVIYDFTIEAGSTNPATAKGTTSVDGAVVIALDCADVRGADGNMYDDIHDHTITQANAGLDEAETSPIGGTEGVLIEGQ